MENYSEFQTFSVLGQEVFIFCEEETAYGKNTVAEINNQLFYLGNIEPDITAAILAYQGVTGKYLSDSEFDLTLKQNLSEEL
jgi:hypothetical protein